MLKNMFKNTTLLLLSAGVVWTTCGYSQSYYHYPQYAQENYSYYSDSNYGYSNYHYTPSSHNDNYYSDEIYRPRRDDYDNRDLTKGLDMPAGRSLPQPDYADWDFRETWRDYRKAFYSGQTQAEAYRKSHPYGEGGIGYDPDPVYLRLKEEYKKEKERRELQAQQHPRINGGGTCSRGSQWYSHPQGGGTLPGRQWNNNNYYYSY